MLILDCDINKIHVIRPRVQSVLTEQQRFMLFFLIVHYNPFDSFRTVAQVIVLFIVSE